jgi:hypothetical protein
MTTSFGGSEGGVRKNYGGAPAIVPKNYPGLFFMPD